MGNTSNNDFWLAVVVLLFLYNVLKLVINALYPKKSEIVEVESDTLSELEHLINFGFRISAAKEGDKFIVKAFKLDIEFTSKADSLEEAIDELISELDEL